MTDSAIPDYHGFPFGSGFPGNHSKLFTDFDHVAFTKFHIVLALFWRKILSIQLTLVSLLVSEDKRMVLMFMRLLMRSFTCSCLKSCLPSLCNCIKPIHTIPAAVPLRLPSQKYNCPSERSPSLVSMLSPSGGILISSVSASGQGAVELVYVSVVSIPVTPSGLTISVMAIWFAFSSFVA